MEIAKNCHTADKHFASPNRTTTRVTHLFFGIIIIIIISLYQKDNIFGTNVSLTYGPQLKR